MCGTTYTCTNTDCETRRLRTAGWSDPTLAAGPVASGGAVRVTVHTIEGPLTFEPGSIQFIGFGNASVGSGPCPLCGRAG